MRLFTARRSNDTADEVVHRLARDGQRPIRPELRIMSPEVATGRNESEKFETPKTSDKFRDRSAGKALEIGMVSPEPTTERSSNRMSRVVDLAASTPHDPFRWIGMHILAVAQQTTTHTDSTPEPTPTLLLTTLHPGRACGSNAQPDPGSQAASVPGMKTCTELRLLVMLDTVP